MEALERRKLWPIAAILFIVFSSQYKGAWAHRNSTKMSYVCPPSFIRLGHSCYYISDKKATWQNALFSCKDRDSNLSVPARWEDRNLRNYLNKPTVEKASRWIGGIYDYNARAWKWGGELRRMHYQSFSKMKKMSPEQLQWHCIAMMPELKYRWAPASCYQPRQYICQTKLRKVPKSKVKDLRRRWQRMGKLNEITAPSVSREVSDPKTNDVTINPMLSPKSYDLRPSQLRLNPNTIRPPKPHHLRPNELRKRSRPTHRRLTKPFPGYQWNRRDPEASYNYNANLLKSGKTGLTPQQVKSHLARLQHLRDKQLERQRRMKENGDWLVNDEPPRMARTHARTYTVDNNISALHPKTIVEEFDMLPPPPPPVPIARLTRGAFRGYRP
ncbi:uncharacterized protein LOC114360562 [Ostrinia furnacalis]|uniref:uncharacterized protein LOC114360562 n=1 Tax=Ostrinia furnacalis TaxID=93504 RepID=UPI001039FBCE|nr:uncharacterized protein LOC114360562 [Ostrinia furnacalis]XP_028171110.1 uncharacterized protein LOC114360562 [Ostrinia furnacalis]